MSGWLFGDSPDFSVNLPPEYARIRDATSVSIETPSSNTRKISASMVVDTAMEDVWSILSDYDNLSTHVPNLTKSFRVPSPSRSGIRIFQEGAQKIVGFTFRASLTMDMVEEPEDQSRALRERNLFFRLVESQMFNSFDGSWKLRTHSRVRELDPATKQYKYSYKTMLTYSVFVKPRGPVPVAALEWRIREDIPVNLVAVKMAAERRASAAALLIGSATGTGSGAGIGSAGKDTASLDLSDGSEGYDAPRTPWQAGWGADETLAAYLGNAATARSSASASATATASVSGARVEPARQSKSNRFAAGFSKPLNPWKNTGAGGSRR